MIRPYVKSCAPVPYLSSVCLQVHHLIIGYTFILYVSCVLGTLKYCFDRKFYVCYPCILLRLSTEIFLYWKRSTVYSNVQFLKEVTKFFFQIRN